MVFTTEHRYISWGGFLPGDETWQCGLRMAADGVASYPEGSVEDGFTAVNSAIRAWFVGSNAAISPRASLTWTKMAIVKPDGHYKELSDNPQITEITPADVGTSSPTGGVVPNQIALVVTLHTGSHFGRAQRGRFYMPMPAVIVGENGQITPTEANTRATGGRLLVVALNAAYTGLLEEKVVVMSKLGSGTTREVTAVSCGTVLDTQRSRRESLVESRVEVPV